MRALVVALALLSVTACKRKEQPSSEPLRSSPVPQHEKPEVFGVVGNITQVAADASFIYLLCDGTTDGGAVTSFTFIPRSGGKPATLNPPMPPVEFFEPRADAVYLLFKSVPKERGAQIERMEMTDASAKASTVIAETFVDGASWMTSDDRYFYYFAGTKTKRTAQTVNRVPITGGKGEAIAKLPDGATATSLVRQGTHLYWATRTTEEGKPDTAAIMSLDIGSDAGALKTVAPIDAAVSHIASDATHLYLTTKPLDGTDNEGSLLRISLADGKVESWVEKQNRPSAIAIDANAVYWGTENGLFMRRKASRMVETLAREESVAETMFVDDRYVFWATTMRLMRVPKE